MGKLMNQLNLAEASMLGWVEKNSHIYLRAIIGLVYILYGGLKFSPSHSPAEQLAVNTIEKLTFGLLSGIPAQFLLAMMETTLGLYLVFGCRLRWAVYAAIGHMMGTFLPIFFFPGVFFRVLL